MSIFPKITERYQKELVESLKQFVAIDSVYDEKTVTKLDPFGKGVSNALSFIADLANKDGFKVTNYDNMVVEILCGEGDKNITILAHADVVPPGEGWNQDPFMAVDRGDHFTGRGVADDKGPLLSAYYALKALRDNHLLGNYQVRFLVGGNEESGSLGMHHYFYTLKKPQPNAGFSPDASFPLIFAEKGIVNFAVKHHFPITHVKEIHGGVAANSVIEKCEIMMDKDDGFIHFLAVEHYDYEVEYIDKMMKVIVHGKAAHGASPELGDNAGMKALDALAKFYQDPNLEIIIKHYSSLTGAGLEASAHSKDMGNNSLNVGLLNYKDNEFSMVVNFRYVDTCKPNVLLENIKKNSAPFNIEILGTSKLLYYPKNSPLVKILHHSYIDETKDDKTPILAIGGGTYAKEADNIIAFGMEHIDYDCYMHSNHERVRKADLFSGIAIYARAIYDLGKALDENKI
ncbi:MAG: Sapep family Mn(2+)-dependent dipeptidase [Bacilli bacterium]|nr:Sapep family Mn(2+)-dependent dipeptidase [Bacilli bacterium]